MKTFLATIAACFLWGLIATAERRADYWRPVIESIAKEAGSGPVKNIRVTPLKGCGWSFGETIYADLEMAGAPTDFVMCRNRQGVRVDLTTRESHWIRGGRP